MHKAARRKVLCAECGRGASTGKIMASRKTNGLGRGGLSGNWFPPARQSGHPDTPRIRRRRFGPSPPSTP